MLLSTFRSSYLPQYLLLLVLAIVLWIPAFLDPPALTVDPCPVSPLSAFVPQLGLIWEALPVLLGLIVLLTQGFLLNVIMIQHDLVSKNSLMPAFIFILLMSADPMNLVLSGQMISGLVILILLNTAYPLYEKSDDLTPYLTMGLLVSTASLFFFPSLFLVFIVFSVLWIYRSFTWREWLIPIIGVMIPYLYIFTFYFWGDDVEQALLCYGNFFSSLVPPEFEALTPGQMAVDGMLLLLWFLPASVSTISRQSSFNISTRKKLAITIWFLIIALFISLITGNLAEYYILYMIPAGIIVSHFLDLRKKNLWWDVILLATYAAMVLNNFLT